MNSFPFDIIGFDLDGTLVDSALDLGPALNHALHASGRDGCLAALDELAARGCRLAVVTNKSEALARKLLAELGMSARFASIMGGDTLGRERSKPAPDMIHETMRINGGGRFAMVGDSAFDVRAARSAAVPVVALSFGYHDVPP